MKTSRLIAGAALVLGLVAGQFAEAQTIIVRNRRPHRRPVYVAPAPVVVVPAPVVVTRPRRVYVAPAPIVVARPRRVYVAPRPVVVVRRPVRRAGFR